MGKIQTWISLLKNHFLNTDFRTSRIQITYGFHKVYHNLTRHLQHSALCKGQKFRFLHSSRMRHIFKQYSYSQFGHILCKKQTSYTKLYSKTLISTQKRATFFLLSQCTLCGAWLSGGRHGMVCVIPQQ